jgi:hypothetical protein
MTHHAVFIASLSFQAVRIGIVGIVDLEFRLSEMTLVAVGLLMAFFACKRIKPGVSSVVLPDKPQRSMRLRLDSLRIVVTHGTVAGRFFIVMT